MGVDCSNHEAIEAITILRPRGCIGLMEIQKSNSADSDTQRLDLVFSRWQIYPLIAAGKRYVFLY